MVEFYDMKDDLNNPEYNLHIGIFRLSGRDELMTGERVNRGDEFIIDWKMSDNGTLSFAVELPKLSRIIDATNLYDHFDGGINYEGRRGAEVAETMLSKVESDLQDLKSALGRDPDPSGDIQKRIERQQSALSTSVDAETHRSVAEESRKLRQDLALLKISPENEEKVLEDEVSKVELSFDRLRKLTQPVDEERHDKLLSTARRAIREKNFDAARRSLEEMKNIHINSLLKSPEFLIGMLQSLANEKHLAVDEGLHERLLAEGDQAIESRDMCHLLFIIRKVMNNRISTGEDAKNISNLADLLGS